ncbi:transcription antitermination factor NusB [Bacillus timonensis]|nr:transcription antitermination factor NusB [Bacillus timonensis]
MKRRTAREKALQALFQIDMSEIEVHDALQNVLIDEDENLEVEYKVDPFLERLVTGVMTNKEEIDRLLRANLEKWTLERVANVDRSILRLAVFEMKFVEEVPVNVAMDEAIELAKVFGDESSSKFINAILSKVKDQL